MIRRVGVHSLGVLGIADMAARMPGISYMDKVVSYGPLGYWPMNEAAGAVSFDYSGNGFNGAYTAVTLGQVGIGDGNTCPLFDGATSFNNLYSLALSNAFPGGAEMTLMAWGRVANAAVWTDGAQRHLLTIYSRTQDRFHLIKAAGGADDKLSWFRRANNVSDVSVVSASQAGVTDWFHVALTVSESADQAKAYLNGTQSGVTVAGLDVYQVATLNTSNNNAGCFNNGVPDLLWNGYLAHAAIFTSALSEAAILDLATV